MEKNCLECGERIFGRSDKRYCSDICRNAYHNKMYSDRNKIMRNVNNALRRNRQILENLITDMHVPVVNKLVLEELGFKFEYITHAGKHKKGKQYQFCYDLGYVVMEDERVLIVNKAEA